MASQNSQQLKSKEQGNNSNRNASIEIERSGHDNNDDAQRKHHLLVENSHHNQSAVDHSVGGINHDADKRNNDHSQAEHPEESMSLLHDTNKYKKPQWKVNMLKFIDHPTIVILMNLVTIYSLFFDDIRVIAVEKENDGVFYGLTLFAMICFIIEIVLASMCKDDYFLSFFFWLDVVSTITMIPDCGWIWTPMTGGSNSASKTTDIAKTSKAGRITRIIRIIRLIRLIRIVKLYKQAKLAQERQEEKKHSKVERKKAITNSASLIGTNQNAAGNNTEEKYKTSIDNQLASQKTLKIHPQGEVEASHMEEHKDGVGEDSFDNELKQIDDKDNQSRSRRIILSESRQDNPEQSVSKNDESSVQQYRDQKVKDEEELEVPIESKISKTLSERTTKIVIILVLVLLFILPLFQTDTYQANVYSHDQGVKIVKNLYSTGNYTAYSIGYKIYFQEHVSAKYPLVYFVTPNITNNIKYEGQIVWAQSPTIEELRSEEYTMITEYASDGSEFTIAFSIKKQSVIESILNISRTLFVCVVLAIASIFFQNDANKLVLTPIERMLEKVKLIAKNPLAAASEEVDSAGVLSMMHKNDNNKGETQQYETAILERAIVKIGHLLALGFGEAGSKIIATNMSQGGDMNPMMAGQRVFAIFGFCDIRNFTDSTEILQTKVMLFVNQIAEITHSQVDKYGGSANKNIGDAFLLVWKFKDDQDAIHGKGTKVSRENQIVADLSLFSFVKIIAKINKLSHILEYRQDKLLNERMPDYKVKMGFGLHYGWAIEGAIGSFFKIDASYLSPNVNMSSRLEAATKQYGVPVLISGDLHNILSDDIKPLCREIDTVTVKGSIKPMRLFTIDLDFDGLEEKPDRFLNQPIKDKKSIRDKEKKNLHAKIASGQKSSWDIYSRDKDFKELRRNYDKMLTKKFSEAYKKYIQGDWATSEDLLAQCLKINPNDGPTITLKSIIEEHNGTSPSNWKGYRELTEK